jgi:hypothetical protein
MWRSVVGRKIGIGNVLLHELLFIVWITLYGAFCRGPPVVASQRVDGPLAGRLGLWCGLFLWSHAGYRSRRTAASCATPLLLAVAVDGDG